MEPSLAKHIQDIYVPSRSLTFYTLSCLLPVVIIISFLLFTNVDRYFIAALTTVGAIVSLYGMSRLLFELTFDLAGHPDYLLPVWSVIYLIIYLIMLFTFIFFSLHTYAPKQFFRGLGSTKSSTTFVDAFYLSLTNYVNTGVNTGISHTGRVARYLSLLEGIISMFINLVIITKFVTTF